MNVLDLWTSWNDYGEDEVQDEDCKTHNVKEA